MKQIDKTGVNACKVFFEEVLGWQFREQTTSDWGIDAHVEVADETKPLGRLLALQIKSGASYFRVSKGEYIYYGKMRHLEYWSDHSLPVILVLHNPDSQTTVWQRIDRDTATIRDKMWSVRIPMSHTLTKNSEAELLKGVSDVAVQRRLLLALDYPIMKRIAANETYFEVEEWVNKHVNFRVTRIYFDDFKSEPDLILYSAYHGSIHSFMSALWPWLTFSFNEQHRILSEEAVLYRLRVQLNNIGQSYLLLEKYLAEGKEREVVQDPGFETEWDEDEMMEAAYQRAMDED